MTRLRCSDYCKGKILTTLIKLENRGLAEGTLRNISFNLKHLAAYANIDDPESVRAFTAKESCANSQKMNLVKAYNYYTVANGIEWKKHEELQHDCQMQTLRSPRLDELRTLCKKTEQLAADLLCYSMGLFKRKKL